MARSQHGFTAKHCRAEPGSKQWQQHLWGCGPCPSALCFPRPLFKGVTHVFWCARWMQLNICPCSGSVLYMVGYCQKINQQQSISKCGLQLLSLGAHKSCVQGHCLPGAAAWLQRLPQASNPAPHALGTFAPILMQQEWDHPNRQLELSLCPPLLVTSVSEVVKEQRSSGLC